MQPGGKLLHAVQLLSEKQSEEAAHPRVSMDSHSANHLISGSVETYSATLPLLTKQPHFL